MKKILLFLGLTLSFAVYGQVPAETAPLTQTTVNSDYGLVFTGSTMKRMTMEYYLPWVYSVGYLRPRSIATNVVIGSSTNYPQYKLTVAGTFGLFDDMTLTAGKKYSFSNGAYISTNALGELVLSSPVTGLQTLAQLAAGGSSTTFNEGNLINIYNGTSTDSISVDKTVLYYNPSFTTLYTGSLAPTAQYYIDQSSTGKYIIAAGVSTGIRVSDDYGATFTEIDSIRTYYGVSISGTGKHILIGDGNNYQLRSTNYGVSFMNMNDTLVFYKSDISHDGKYQAAIYGDEDLPGAKLFVSHDSGSTWIERMVDAGRPFMDVEISDNGKYISVATADSDEETGGVWVSSDSGATWTQRLITGDMYTVAMSGSGQYQLATGYNTYKSSNYGVTWTTVGITSLDCDISTNGKDQILKTASNIRYSADYGVTWAVLVNTTGNISLSGDGNTLLVANNITIKRLNINQSLEVKKPVTFNEEITANDSIRLAYEGLTPSSDMYVKLSATGALVPYKPVTAFQIVLTDSIVVTNDTTGYELFVFSNLAGMNLVGVELAAKNSTGSAVPSVTVWRSRGATMSNMTSTGANFTTGATINTNFDDVTQGDRIYFKWTLGAGTPPNGMVIYLKFQQP